MRPDTIERFWARKIVTESGCWEWTGSRKKATPKNPWGSGYGKYTRWDKKKFQVHRLAWELTHGPIPSGIMVLHKCDNPPCFNPDHLYLGTHQDNMNDMIARDRNKGIRKHWDKYIPIKQLRKEGLEYAEIAIKLGVSRSLVHAVLRGDRDKRIPDKHKGAVRTRFVGIPEVLLLAIQYDRNVNRFTAAEISRKYGISKGLATDIVFGRHQHSSHLIFNPIPPREKKTRRIGPHHAKLTAEQVLEIRRRYTEDSSYGYKARLSAEFGVNKKSIQGIVHGKHWKSL